MGTSIILDEASLLTVDDLRELRQVAAKLPFDVRILIRSGTDAPSLARATEAQVTNDRVMAIGIDPAGRTTSVYFGRALRIPPGQHATIRSAANPHFRTGHFTDGLAAIQEAAAQVVQVQSPLAATPSPDAPVPAPPVTVAPPPKTQAVVGVPTPLREEAVMANDHWWTFFWCAVGFAIFTFAVGTWVLYRQRKFALAARACTPTNPTEMATITDMPPPSLRTDYLQNTAGLGASTTKGRDAFQRAGVAAPHMQAATGSPPPYREDDDDAEIPTQTYAYRSTRSTTVHANPSATTLIDRDQQPPPSMPRPRTPPRPRDDDSPQDYADHRRHDDDSGPPLLAIAGISALAGYAAGRSSASTPSAPALRSVTPLPTPPPVEVEDDSRKGWTSAHGDTGGWGSSDSSASSGGDTGGWGDVGGGGSDGGTSEW